MTNSAPLTADPTEIARTVQLLWEPGTVMEIRCPKTPRGVVSGYYDRMEALIRDSAYWSGRAEAVYITLNPVLPDLLARAYNRAAPYSKHTTKDQEIVRRRWFLVDFDPVRPAGISATEAEHAAALLRARECREWMRDRGWAEPIFADSGNGAHLLYPLDRANDDATRRLLEQCLEALAARFSDATVQVDRTTFNASRISKVYGTLAAKGDSVPKLGRVHRLARILEAPGQPQVLGLRGGTA